MKLELEIPDWSENDRTIYIMSGIELVAYKSPKQNWFVKIGSLSSLLEVDG